MVGGEGTHAWLHGVRRRARRAAAFGERPMPLIGPLAGA